MQLLLPFGCGDLILILALCFHYASFNTCMLSSHDVVESKVLLSDNLQG